MNFSEDELLMLSGIQHIAFCERQWAFIHIEQQWEENVLTIEGHHMHQRVDDPFESEMLKNKIIIRSMSIVSQKLGLYGRADVVELLPAPEDSVNSIEFEGRSGRWTLTPIEYKRGKPKSENYDTVQLCAQAMCIEEMYAVEIHQGWLFYGETRHRLEVEFTQELRQTVEIYSKRMHELFAAGITPLANYKPHCKSCSLVNVCLPEQFSEKTSVAVYLSKCFQD